MESATFNIDLFSNHLFWDVDIQKLTLKKDKRFIVKRILEYGLLSDWTELNKYLDIEEIADAVSNIKDLDYKSLSFIAAISKRRREDFLCYTTQQSTISHWNF
jgi:hypothetical protein